MKSTVVVTVSALNKYRRFGQTLDVNIAVVVVQMNAFADVLPARFYRCATVNIRESAQAKSTPVTARIRIAIDEYIIRCCMKYFADSCIQFVINY